MVGCAERLEPLRHGMGNQPRHRRRELISDRWMMCGQESPGRVEPIGPEVRLPLEKSARRNRAVEFSIRVDVVQPQLVAIGAQGAQRHPPVAILRRVLRNLDAPGSPSDEHTAALAMYLREIPFATTAYIGEANCGHHERAAPHRHPQTEVMPGADCGRRGQQVQASEFEPQRRTITYLRLVAQPTQNPGGPQTVLRMCEDLIDSRLVRLLDLREQRPGFVERRQWRQSDSTLLGTIKYRT